MRTLPTLAGLAALAVLAAASPALADPCEAIDAKGHLPDWLTPGEPFTGQVRYVGDGDSLCVGSSDNPTRWIEVRVEDFNAPELREPGGHAARKMLAQIALGRTVRCRGWRTNHDRLVATCWLDGVSLGDRMRRAGIAEGGN